MGFGVFPSSFGAFVMQAVSPVAAFVVVVVVVLLVGLFVYVLCLSLSVRGALFCASFH